MVTLKSSQKMFPFLFSFLLITVLANYVYSQEDPCNLKSVYPAGYGLTTTGFVLLGCAMGTLPLIISMGNDGNFGGAIAFSLIGGAFEIVSPLLMSGGATKVQRAYQNCYGYDCPGKNWLFYQVGIGFTIASRVVGLIPATQKILYEETETSGNMTVTKKITYSPAAIVIGSIGHLFYLINGINAYNYIGKVKKAGNPNTAKLSIIPVFEHDGRYGIKLAYHF